MRKLLPLIAVILLTGCPKGAQGLAAASDTIAHSLNDTQQAVNLACQAGQIDSPTCNLINGDIIKVATIGKSLDADIRANETTTGLAPTVNAFIAAFNQLENNDLIGIKNPNTKIAISTILTGAESAISIISATIGAK